MPIRADRLLPYVRQIAFQAAPDDAALLTRFLTDRDPAAFEALVARHGPMVLRVCRRVLGNAHDAEDAFQATFLVLARKAASVRPAGAVAAFLHGVACRVARGARSAAARRRLRELHTTDRAPADPRPDPLAELTAREALHLLDEEVQCLPAVYRLPVILCCLEGLSQEEAARQLGWTPGSVKGRLERGRRRLHQRLARRGLEPAVAFGLVEVARATAGAAGLPAASTAQTALAFAAGEAAAGGGPSAHVVALAEQGLRGMALVKAKVGLAAALLLGMVAVAGVLARPAAVPPLPPHPKAPVRPEPEGKRPRADRFGDPLPPGAVARIGTVRWWCGATDAQFRFHSLVYTPDGKALVACDVHNVVRFLDAVTGRELRRINLAGEGAVRMALSPDGKWLATVDWRSLEVRIWEVATGKVFRRLEVGDTSAAGVAFSPDGKAFAAATGTNTIVLWDTATWKETRRFLGKKAGWCEFLFFLPDGKTLIGGDRRAVRWWDASSGGLVRLVDRDLTRGFYDMAVSPDGKRLALAVQDNVLLLWDAATGNEVRRIVPAKSRGGWCLCFSPDGRTLACANGVGRRGHATVFLAADTGRELRRWDEDDRHTAHMAYSPDGKVLAQARSGVIWLRDAATGKPVRPTPGLTSAVLAVRFSADGRKLITSCMGGRTGFWGPRTGKPLAAFQDPPKDFDQRMYLYPGPALMADGSKSALVDVKGVLHVWETATGKECCRIAEPPPLHDRAAFSADGRLVAIGHRDNTLRIWEATTGKLLHTIPQPARHFPKVLGFSPDGRILASYSATSFTDRTIRLWDTTTGKVRDRLAWPEDTGPAGLTWTGDGKRLIASFDPGWPEGTASHRIGLCVWDLTTGRELFRIRGATGAIVLSPDEKTLAAADGRTIHLWEMVSGKERGRFTGHRERIQSLAFSPDGRLLASGGLDYTALVWDVTGVCPDGKWSVRDVRPGEIERLWDDLGSTEGVRAYRARWRLAAARQTVPFLARRLRPVPRIDAKRLHQLIADLDSDQFETRRRATKELGQLGELAEPALRQALANKPSPEVRRGLQALLDAVGSRSLSAEQLQALRAVEVLEQIGTPDARRVLEVLATGAPGARLTRAARAALAQIR